MSGKGKKKGKGSNEAITAEAPAVTKMTPELYELKIKDLEIKAEHWSQRLNEVQQNLTNNMQETEKMAKDKDDVIEFLRLQLLQNETKLATVTSNYKELESDRDKIRDQLTRDKEEQLSKAKNEIIEMQVQCYNYKRELDNLLDFKARKNELENHVANLSKMLEDKDREFKEAVHDLERKSIQDKSLLRKEMLGKVNEVVTSFRNLSDQQMAETTKRTIQENIAVNSQLQKLSSKVVDLLQENKNLLESQTQIKQQIEISLSNERELAQKSQSYKRIIKLLIDKNQEMERMIEESSKQDDEKGSSTAVFDSKKPLSIQIDNFDFGDLKEENEEEETTNNPKSWFGNQSTEIQHLSQGKPEVASKTTDHELIIDSLAIIFELLRGSRRAKSYAKSAVWLSDLEAFFGDQLDHDKAESLSNNLKLDNEKSKDVEILKFLTKSWSEHCKSEPANIEHHKINEKESKSTLKEPSAHTTITPQKFVPPYKKGEQTLQEALDPILNQKTHTIGVQTVTAKLDPSLLLGEVRPWGHQAKSFKKHA